MLEDPYEKAYESVDKVFRAPGVIYDDRMVHHYCQWDPNYPEKPERYQAVKNRIEELGLMSKLQILEPRLATPSEIEMVHSREHRKMLEAMCASKYVAQLEKASSKYDAIYMTENTYELALLAAGSTIELVDQICRGSIPSGFAIIRPPGHHAMRNEYCGYCFFNNAAIAARHAIDNVGLRRVMIIDWDVHHGQATQQMTYKNRDILYFSIHRYEHGAFWPNLRCSDYDMVGEGLGQGYNVNVPLNKTGMTNADYLAIFHQLLLPMAHEYQPDLVIISAGYDAALGCPEGEMRVTPECYAHLLWLVKALASGKIAVVLEGGYCLESLAEGAALTTRALIGQPCPPLVDPLEEISEEVVTTILDVIAVHQPYWNCFLQSARLNEPLDPRDENNFFTKVHVQSELTFLSDGIKPEVYPTRDCYPVQSEEVANNVDYELTRLRRNTELLFAPNKVAYAYDEVMMDHQPKCEAGRVHPEDPQRLSATYNVFLQHGLTERCKRVGLRLATMQDLLSVHSIDLVNDIRMTAVQSEANCEVFAAKYGSITVNSHTHKCVLHAVGYMLQLVDEVLSGRSQAGVAIIRPPGHHASRDKCAGFCYVNNVAIAAKYAISKFCLRRILIVDWDVHHGDGTQEIFYDDEKVLYISLHVFRNGTFYPGTMGGDLTFTGGANAKGYNVNIPWSKTGVNDEDYMAAFHSIILPIAYEFNPELVIVSAGFDAAVNDPIGRCNVTPEAFGHMTHYLSGLANGKIILALEGGYNKESVSVSMALCTKSLLGDPLPMLDHLYHNVNHGETATLQRVGCIQAPFWKNLRFNAKVISTVLAQPQMDETLTVTDDSLSAGEGSESDIYVVEQEPAIMDVVDLTLEESDVTLEESDE